MRFVKLFVLLALLTSVWGIESQRVNAQTDCYYEYQMCGGNAESAFDACITNCSGRIACEIICELFYDMSIQQCEYDLQICLNP